MFGVFVGFFFKRKIKQLFCDGWVEEGLRGDEKKSIATKTKLQRRSMSEGRLHGIPNLTFLEI